MKTAIKTNLIEDILSIVTLASVNQKKYYRDLLDAAEPVKMVSIKDVFSRKEIYMIKRLVRPKKKICYRNAHLLTTLFPDKVKYVDGRVSVTDIGIPIDHAFNRVGDKYVDITFEMVWNEDTTKYEYIKFGEYDLEQVEEIAEHSGIWGECYKFQWMKENNCGKIL